MPVPAEKDIAALQVGDRITGFYILKDAVVRTSSSGKPFLAGAVSDRTGSIDLKIWDYGGPVGSADAGRAVNTFAGCIKSLSHVLLGWKNVRGKKAFLA